MKSLILTASLLVLTFSQTACLTTVELDPHRHKLRHHHNHHGHTVHVARPHPVHVPVYRPARTIVTVRRY